MFLKLNEPYVASAIKSGVGKKNNKKWQMITAEGIDRIQIFVDNDIDLNIGDTFCITKINKANFSVSKHDNKFFNNFNINAELKRVDIGGDIDEDFDSADIDKVLA